MGKSSSASVRSSLSKSSKKKEGKDKKKKSSKKSHSSSSSSKCKSVGDPPSSANSEVPLQVECPRVSAEGAARTSALGPPEHHHESSPPSPASILKTQRSASTKAVARTSRDPPTSPVRGASHDENRSNQAEYAAPPTATAASKNNSPSKKAVAPPPTSSSLPIPEHVTFDDSNHRHQHEHPDSNHSSNGSIRVSFSNDVVSVSSTTYDDATYSEDDDDEDDDEEEDPALPTLVTQALWSPEVRIVRSALRDLVYALTSKDEDEGGDADELDPRHEALLLGGHLSLIRVLQTHLQQPAASDVAIQALQALLLMFENVNVYWLGVLGSMGAMEAVVSTMMVKAKDLTVQEQAYRLLVSLLGVKANAVAFLRLDGLAAVFRRLAAFPEDRDTNLDVCHVLKKLCEWEDTRSMLVASGAVSTLAKVIDRCSGNDGTSVTSATTLTTDSPSVDGMATVASSASTIAHDSAVQSSAYETMVALVAPERRGSHHRRHDRRVGNSSPSSLSKKASKLKRRSTTSSRSSSSGSRRHRHSCETVLEEELQQERDAEDVPESPMQPYQEYSTMIVRDLWSDCDEVVLAALKEIASTLDRCKITYGKAFIEVGGPLAVTKVMESRRCTDVQQAGCEILHTLVSLEGFPTILGEVGGVETLLERLRDGSSLKLRKSALKALAKMLKGSNSNTQRFIAAGGVPVMVRVMDLHYESSSFQEEACKVLKLCCRRSSDASHSKYRTAIMKSGGATAIARVLELHYSDAKALKAAKKAMKALVD